MILIGCLESLTSFWSFSLCMSSFALVAHFYYNLIYVSSEIRNDHKRILAIARWEKVNNIAESRNGWNFPIRQPWNRWARFSSQPQCSVANRGDMSPDLGNVRLKWGNSMMFWGILSTFECIILYLI